MAGALSLSLSLSLPDVRNGIRDDLTLIAAFSAPLSRLVVVVKSIAAADSADFAVGHRRVTMDGDGGGASRGSRKGGRVAAGRMSRLCLGLGTGR